VDSRTFLQRPHGRQLYFSDVAGGLVKSLVFGLVIGSRAATSARHKGALPGVGRAVNATVVASAAGVFVLDYLVSFLLA